MNQWPFPVSGYPSISMDFLDCRRISTDGHCIGHPRVTRRISTTIGIVDGDNTQVGWGTFPPTCSYQLPLPPWASEGRTKNRHPPPSNLLRLCPLPRVSKATLYIHFPHHRSHHSKEESFWEWVLGRWATSRNRAGTGRCRLGMWMALGDGDGDGNEEGMGLVMGMGMTAVMGMW